MEDSYKDEWWFMTDEDIEDWLSDGEGEELA